MLRLYTFVISHFSEKARWALDWEGVSYEERYLIPGPHMPVVRRRAPKTTVPLLEHGARVIQGSSAILDYLRDELDVRLLTPPPEQAARVAELETLADHAFGLGMQRILYSELLADRQTLINLWSAKGPRWGRAFYAVAYPVVASAVRRMYTIRPDAVARAKQRLRDAIGETDRALGANPYLTGSAPTRADVTVAALLAPMVRPAEHIAHYPAVPSELGKFVSEFEGGPTWNHVLRMYREHRYPHAARLSEPSRVSELSLG